MTRICIDIDQIGLDQSKFMIATSNNTENDSQIAAMIYWNKIHEEAITEITRGEGGEGGCSCNIF